MLKVRNLGRRSLEEVLDKLSEYGIVLEGSPARVVREEISSHPLDDINIDDLDLTVRSYNCLKRAGINTVGDLRRKTSDDMLKVRNLGRRSLEEIISKMRELEIWFAPNGKTDSIFEELDVQAERKQIRQIPPHDADDEYINSLDLSVRSVNCLMRAGIRTVRDLREKTSEDMMKVRNLGRKNLQEITEKMNFQFLEYNFVYLCK